MSNVADIIARRLYEAGCRHAFGIPGGEVLTLMRALQEAGVAFHLCKHENAGGFMAEGTHHADRAPAVLLATVGPGVVNAVNTVANAWQDQVPMIFISGCVDAAEAVTYTHQVFDHTAVLAPVTKASMTITADAVDATIDKAVAIAMDDPPGPVHIDVPIGIAKAIAADSGRTRRAKPSPVAPAPGPDLDAARAALTKADRPLMIAGVDILHHDAAPELSDFCRRLGVPLITSYKAKGVLPEDDPLALGGHGLSPKSFAIVKPLIDQADVIILAGYDPIEMRVDWRNAWIPGNGDGDGPVVIELASHANTHYVHQASINFVCHVGAGLKILGDRIEMGTVWPGGEPAATRAALREAFPRDEVWGPAAVIDTVRQTFPRDGVVTVDTGAHRILISQQWESYAPRTLLQSTGLCTMGVALPIAIGHTVADPSRPVLAFTGDAGMEMILGELATARDLAVPVIVVVFVDEQLALIEIKQRRDGHDNLGVNFGGTNFAAVAEAMGGTGVVASNRGALGDAVTAALGRDGFTLIACPIGREPYDGRF